MRKGVLFLLLLVAASAFAGDTHTYGGGFSTRWKTRGAHGHDQEQPCDPQQCDRQDFDRANLDDSIGYRAGVERDFFKPGIFRLVGGADGSLSYTEYNLTQNDMLIFAGALTAGADVAHRGFRLGARYGGGAYATTTGGQGLRWFHELVASVPLRSGASLRISRRYVDNTDGFTRYHSNFFPQEGPIEVTETAVMFVASPEVHSTAWEFSTSSGTSQPGGPIGEHRFLKQAGWHRLTAARELPWLSLEARASWTAFAHESWIATDFRGFPGNERSKTVDAFGLGVWRQQRLGDHFSLHYGAGIEAADWRDEHHLLLDRQLRDIIGGIETSAVLGAALRMRLGRSTALEANVEKSYWTGIRLGEVRWGIGLVLTR
jgi:hypothetical protein